MQSSNPAFKRLTSPGSGRVIRTGEGTMSVGGTINRIAILFLCLLGTAFFAFYQGNANPGHIYPMFWIGMGGGLIFALVTIFKSEWARYTAPVYALFEGLFLGSVSFLFNQLMPGIAQQAIALTFAIFFIMLFAYRSGLIKATQRFRSIVVAATGGIFLFYLVTFALRMFGINIPYIHSMGPLGIGISAAIVIIASLNLILDFDSIEEGERSGAPESMEWYAAFGLMLTLVWLYVEVLRLIWILYSFFDD